MLFRERQQITQVIIYFVAGAMIGGFVLFRYLPLQKKVKAAEQARAAQILSITKGMSQSRQLPVLKQRLLKLQRAVENYEANIPAQRGLGGFLHRIADLMNEHNLKEQLVQPGREIKGDELNCIPVDMKCKGTLAQVFEFCKSLQNLDRLVRIEQVRLENDSDFSGQVSVQTKASIYYRPEADRG